MAQDYRDLAVWRKAIDLTVCIYGITQSLPKSELYGLTSQMRRASVSVASNIAEGRGRLNSAEFRQFLGLAQGSLYDLETHLVVCRRLGFATANSLHEAESLSNEASRMLGSFIQTLTTAVRVNKSITATPKLAARS
jgi:four helix bundle protein